MTTATMSVMVPREQEERNQHFGNSGSLESVERLLHKIAMKCHARVSAMGLGMDFDDVKQEMYVSYIKAKEKWNPQGGARFSTYCTTVCINNFNHAIKKMELERERLGLISTEIFARGEDGDSLEIGMTALSVDSPEYRLESAQETTVRLNSLSQSAKLFVSLLLKADQNKNVIPPSLRMVGRMAKLEGKELQRVKQEILATYGVKWH